jgi:hypothetical protein
MLQINTVMMKQIKRTYVLKARLNCIYLGVGLTLMHILPGLMILYVYWPTKRQTDMKSSLLISSSEEKNFK